MPEPKSPKTSHFDQIDTLKTLGEPLPETAIQRTKAFETHKSYDTDGYGYQACVDRFNEVLGTSWGFRWEILKEVTGKYSSGKPYYDITVLMRIWINTPDNTRSCAGGHISLLYADALKGAITNSFKKTAAFWGVGRQAYLGMLDDDNKPLPEEEGKGMRNGGNDKPQDKPQSKPKEFASKEQRNNLVVIPAYLAVSVLNDDATSIEICAEASNVYRGADKFGIEKGLPTPSPSDEKLSAGRAGSIIKNLKEQLFARGFDVPDAVAWWDQLSPGLRHQYSWWEGDDNVPF